MVLNFSEDLKKKKKTSVFFVLCIGKVSDFVYGERGGGFSLSLRSSVTYQKVFKNTQKYN